ncbi:recombinase family protein [Cyanothece sp. BG0011]|uniref:recombinase family protein n=1 Tax=Cyanothece sp. BG0011 TaxID=2082950 RepID=UPI000D1ED298|nr:recombinase family protein [Cyanothece sp. BG0011]
MIIYAYFYSEPLLENDLEIPINHLKIDQSYHDLGARYELEKLLNDCQKKPPNYLLIGQLEDLGDNAEIVKNTYQKLTNLGIKILALANNKLTDLDELELLENTTKIDINDPKLLETIKENQRNLSLKKGQALTRIKALPPPGKAPYGYRRGKDCYIIDRSTAPIIKDFFEQFLLFGSLRGAVNYLAKRYGKKISVSTGSRWLKNPVYRGDLKYKNNEIISNTHMPILSREEAAQIDRLLGRNRKLSSKTASAKHSLVGLVSCQKCHQSMSINHVTQRKKKKDYLYIRPQNCPLTPQCKAIPYQEVLQKTIDYICQNFPKKVKNFDPQKIATYKNKIQTQIEEKKDIINQLSFLVKSNILDDQTANLRRYHLNLEMSQLRSQLEQLPPENLKKIADAVSLPRFWQDLSEAERRFYFREFIRQIYIEQTSKVQWNLEITFII